MKTDDELKQLARDIHAGLVFTSDDVRVPQDAPEHVRAEIAATSLRMIFLPLALADQPMLDHLAAQKPKLLYEYLSKSGPRGMNGYPQFFSVSVVTEEEWPKLQAYRTALQRQPDPLADR